jgi:hypothetical protein
MGSDQKPSKIMPITVISLIVIVVGVLTAWAFTAHLHPDRVGDFASFLQMCVTVIRR